MPYKDPQKEKAHRAEYYQKNKKRIIQYTHDRYHNNKEEINASKRDQYNSDESFRLKVRDQAKKHRQNNRDAILVANRTPKRRFIQGRSYAKRRGFNFSITLEEYTKLVAEHCHYCQNQLGTTIDATGIGLDRLDNTKGYEMDNVVSCCMVCNRLKGEFLSEKETLIAVKAIIKYRKKNI